MKSKDTKFSRKFCFTQNLLPKTVAKGKISLSSYEICLYLPKNINRNLIKFPSTALKQ